MLYNKNNVRKANDKKVLHKVGKQWKVISVALLMAVAGGAVATQANADSNNKGVNAATSAEVTALEQKPAVASATSVAPSSASKSTSASAKPASSVSYMNDNGGSAASYHAKASSDNAQYKVNSALVQSYVSSLNAVFPSATNSLNDAYNSAATKTNADKAAAQSYSDIANNKNYSSQVSTLASKAGLTYSGFVQSVSAMAQGYNGQVSYGSSLNSEMNTVNSYAQLINNIQSNSALSNEYAAKSVSASANYKVAVDADDAAKSVYNHFVGASAGYQDAINNVKSASASNSDAEKIALIYAGLDAATTNSLASELHFTNSSATSNQTHAIVDAKAFKLDNYAKGEIAHYSNDVNADVKVPVQASNAAFVNGLNKQLTEAQTAHNSQAANDIQGKLNAVASADAMFTLFSDTSQEDQYNAASAFYNSELASYASDSVSVSSAVNSASAALNSANNSLSSATSEYSATAVLGDHPTLSELFDIVAPSTDTVATANANAKVVGTFNNAVANALGIKGVRLNGVNPAHVAEAYKTIENPSFKGQIDQLLTSKMGSPKAQQELQKFGVTPNTKVSDALNAANSKFKDLYNQPLNLVQLISAQLVHSSLYQHQLVRANVPFIAKALANKVMSEAHSNKTIAQAEADVKAGADKTIQNVQADPNLKAAVGNASAQYQKDANDNRTHNQAATVKDHQGILPANSYGFAMRTLGNLANVRDYGNPVASAAASSVNSITNSVGSSFASVQSASSSYSAATDENVTLAGIYATSYSNEANSDEAGESNAKNSLDSFYLNHADASYANASSAAASEYAAEPNDVALAQANGVNVFNYAPKYITVVKNCGLYRNTDFAKKAHMMTVPVGTQLKVTGVGFSVNGRTRYTVNYKGHNGYVTSWSGYVQQTYLPTQNNVSVTVTKDSKIYNSAKFTNKSYVGKTLKAGTVLPNVNVVSYDNVYGGVSRLETPSGKFVSANIAYASLNGEADNGNANNNTVTPSHNGVVSYWN